MTLHPWTKSQKTDYSQKGAASMNNQPEDGKPTNAWLCINSPRGGTKLLYARFAVELEGPRKLNAAIAEGDWLLLADTSGFVTRVGRVLRIRSDLGTTTIYFDRLRIIGTSSNLAAADLVLPATASMTRLQWGD